MQFRQAGGRGKPRSLSMHGQDGRATRRGRPASPCVTGLAGMAKPRPYIQEARMRRLGSFRRAPKGRTVSSRRFQPADSIAPIPTPTGLTPRVEAVVVRP